MTEHNIYKEFFQTLKEYLAELEIDNDDKIKGCYDTDVEALESKYGILPKAYVEYLKSIGNHMLFNFMDAEDMSYQSLNYIESFGKEVFKNNNFKTERPYIVISERRNEYISLIYLDEGDDPNVWIMSEYWDEENRGENLVVRSESLTKLMLSFFSEALINKPFTFYFVDSKIKDKEAFLENRFNQWKAALAKVNYYVNDRGSKGNTLVKALNNAFIEYYNPNKKPQKASSQNTQIEQLKENQRIQRSKDRIYGILFISIIIIIALLIISFR